VALSSSMLRFFLVHDSYNRSCAAPEGETGDTLEATAPVSTSLCVYMHRIPCYQPIAHRVDCAHFPGGSEPKSPTFSQFPRDPQSDKANHTSCTVSIAFSLPVHHGRDTILAFCDVVHSNADIEVRFYQWVSLSRCVNYPLGRLSPSA